MNNTSNIECLEEKEPVPKKKIDYLEEDDPLPGQNYVCMSFVSPEGIRNCTIRGLKIRGVFDTYEEATAHASKLRDRDPRFHVFVGQMGKWLPWDPEPSSVHNQEYYEDELQKLMKGNLENQERIKQLEQERRRNEIARAVKEEAENAKRNPTRERLKKKVEKMNQEKMNLDKLKEQEEIKRKEKQAADLKVKQAKEQITTVDKNINRIEDLYNKLIDKKQQHQQA